jgi:transposase
MYGGVQMKHKRDFKELERRRLEGAKLLSRGKSKSEVARELGVARQTVAVWERRLAEGGKEALKRGKLGRPRQIDAEQERELGKALMAGALATKKPLHCASRLFAALIGLPGPACRACGIAGQDSPVA